MATRSQLYFKYLVQIGAKRRWGDNWHLDKPERITRLGYEMRVIETAGFQDYFMMLARILDYCRQEGIVYGPGRGSVGGSAVAYVLGIHEADPLEFGLLFERFMNPDRVAHPDVDIDVSQRDRGKVLDFIRREFEDEHTAVLQVAAFARAGARGTIDMMFAAKQTTEPQAGGIAESLKKLLPEGANVTGGTKQERELAFWLNRGKDDKEAYTGNQKKFVELAEGAGWLDSMLKLDGIQTHLQKHAAGVVILSREDLARLPQTSADGHTMLTGFDMYSLDALAYLKIDILGLRTLDILSDAHKFLGGDGTTPSLMRLWQEHREDPAIYRLLCDADTLGIFQVETSGYRKTLKEFQPKKFLDIVQLNALYRPGALDFTREDGKNMVEVFIDRRKGKEQVVHHSELKARLEPILGETEGIILYQEQSMAAARELAGFSAGQADELRKAIGKKLLDLMKQIEQSFKQGMRQQGYSNAAATLLWDNIAAAGRYSWNKAHSVFYGSLTCLCAYFKANPDVDLPELGLKGNGTAAYYAALINSLDEVKDRQAEAIAEARQHVEIRPPDINIAKAEYTLDKAGRLVFGLNGIKGMGETNRQAIIQEREKAGPFLSFKEFHQRLPSVPINMKLSLIRCGAFDVTESRAWLLGRFQDQRGKEWTVAEYIKYVCGLAKPRPMPDFTAVQLPDERTLLDAEMQTIGFYVSKDPMADVNRALQRLDKAIHWGGQIETVRTKIDRSGREMGYFTLLTPALQRQRCMVFSSNWGRCKDLVQKGNRVIVRGHVDGSQVLAEALFPAGDYRHFQIMKLSRNGEVDRQPFDGKLATVELAEASGYKVSLL